MRTALLLHVPLASVQLDDDEIAAAIAVLQSGQLCQGEVVAEFETQFATLIGARHAIAVSSGSAALLVAMQAMGVAQGDEVIVPDITFVATATAAMYLGATPVFCDISLDDYCIDPACAASLINERTKLIVPVHFGGRVVPMEPLRALAAEHGIALLEDAAGAHLSGAPGRYAGTLGDAAIFSFTPTKLMTTGEGGMITTSSGELAEKCRLIRNFGDAGKFDWQTLGFNFRMTEISAAIGLVQLKRLPQFVAQRRHLAQRYAEALENADFLILPRPTAAAKAVTDPCNYQLYPIMLKEEQLGMDRDRVMARLAECGVASRLYYPPLHRMGVFAGLHPPGDEQFPAAVALAESSLCLPIFGGMTSQQQQHVIDTVLQLPNL